MPPLVPNRLYHQELASFSTLKAQAPNHVPCGAVPALRLGGFATLTALQDEGLGIRRAAPHELPWLLPNFLPFEVVINLLQV